MFLGLTQLGGLEGEALQDAFFASARGGYAAACGREPAGITISLKAPIKFDDAGGTPRTLLSGPPAQVVEDLCAYAAVGVEHFVLDFSVATVPAMLEVMDRFAAEVRPHVRA